MEGSGGFVVGSIIARLLLDKSGWDQSVSAVVRDTSKLEGKAKSLSDQWEKFGSKMQNAGKSMMLFGGSITAGLAVGVTAFASFDAAMTESLAIMGNISGEMRADLVNAARQVARETTFSAAQAAKAYYYIASAGYSAAEAVKVLPVAARFAQAGMFDLERATTLLADAQSALGMRIRDDAVANMQNMTRVADVLSRANIMANASIEQFSESLTTRAGAALRLVGKDVEEGTAVLAAFADQGVKGAEAGTRLDIVLRDLQTRAIQNKEVFEKYRVSVFDSNGEMRNMADIIGDLERALAGKSDEQKRAILMEMEFADRSVASILNLVGMSDQIRVYEKELRKAGGTTKEIADKQLQTLNSQIKLTKNAVTGMAAAFGETLVPIVTQAVVKIRELATDVAALARKYPELTRVATVGAGAVGLLFTVVGGGVFFLGTFARSLANIVQLMPGFTSFFVKAAPLLARFSALTGAAFAGWNLGRYIGQVTGLDKTYEGAFDKAFRFVGIIKEQNREMGAGHAAAAALQTEAYARASELAGEKISRLIDAKRILGKEFEKTGTTGNKVLDEWLRRFPPVVKAATDLPDPVRETAKAMDELAESLGLVSRSELEKKFSDMLVLLSQFRGKLTDSGQKKFTEDLIALRSELDGTTPSVVTVEQTLASLMKMIEDSVSEGDVATIGEEFSEFAREAQREFEEMNKGVAAEILGMQAPMGALNMWIQMTADQAGVSTATVIRYFYELRREVLATVGIIIPAWPEAGAAAERAAEQTKSAWQEVSTVVADAEREIARSIIESFGIHKALVGEAKEFDSSYYDEMVAQANSAYEETKRLVEARMVAVREGADEEAKAIKAAYDDSLKAVRDYYQKAEEGIRDHYEEAGNRIKAYYDRVETATRRAFSAQELRISREEEDEDDRYEKAYQREREQIENSELTEKQKQKALKKLQEQYEAEKKVRDRRREDERIAREIAQEERLEAIREKGRQREHELQKRLQDRLERLAVKREAREKQLALEKEARENAAADRRAAAEAALMAELLAAETAHDADVAALKAAEETARQAHADAEEARQKSLWTKIKTIGAEAIEQLGTAWLTRLIGRAIPSLDSLLGKAKETLGSSGLGSVVGKAASGIGNIFTGLATTVGAVITTLAAAVGTVITTLATAIATALPTLAAGIAAAAATLVTALPNLMLIAAAAIAIYAGFEVVKGLIGKVFGGGGGGAGDGMGRVVERQDQQTAILAAIIEFCRVNIAAISGFIIKPLEVLAYGEPKAILANIAEWVLGGKADLDAICLKLDWIGKSVDKVEGFVSELAAVAKKPVTAGGLISGGAALGLSGAGGGIRTGPGVPEPGTPYIPGGPIRRGPMIPTPEVPYVPGGPYRRSPFVPIPGKPYVPPGPLPPAPKPLPIPILKDWGERIYYTTNIIRSHVKAIMERLGAGSGLSPAPFSPRDISLLRAGSGEVGGVTNLNINLSGLDGESIRRVFYRDFLPELKKFYIHKGNKEAKIVFGSAD